MSAEVHEAKVKILAGTDCPNPFVVPGFALHDELALLVDAGYTPLEAIQLATQRAAEFLGVSREQGTVAAGKTADLVLLNADPLKDIHNTRKIIAVVSKGKLLDLTAISKMLGEVEAAGNDLLAETR